MLRFSAFLPTAVLLLLPTAVLAQTPISASERTVTFTIINGDLLTTLVRLERQYHIQCVLQDGIDAHSKINISLSDVPLSLTLRYLASSTNAQVTQSPGGVYVFTPKPMVALTDPSYSMPPPHFIGGFNPLSPGHSLQQYLVAFPHTPAVGISDLLNWRKSEHTLPDKAQRVFSLGQSF